MQRDIEKLVYDLQTAANDIQQFVNQMSYDDYHANKLVKALSNASSRLLVKP